VLLWASWFGDVDCVQLQDFGKSGLEGSAAPDKSAAFTHGLSVGVGPIPPELMPHCSTIARTEE